MKHGNRRWLGWLAIGLGALALLFALVGRGSAQQMMAGGSQAPQAYAEQRAGAQSGPGAAGAGGQSADGRAGGGRAPGMAAPRPAAPRGAEQAAGAGPGRGGRFGLPFKLFGAVTRLGLLGLLAVLGVWLIRGRRASAAASAAPAAPAPEQLSPTGEFYREESDTDEPGDQA